MLACRVAQGYADYGIPSWIERVMRSCEIAVLGLGIIGSAALYALAQRRADVLGFDPLEVGEPRGSSHGSCRVYRRFNFENPAYTALSDQALAGWRALEAASRKIILKPSRVLEAGPPGSTLVSASRAAARKANVSCGLANGAEANLEFPAFHLPDDWDVVVQPSGGILLAENAMQAFREGAGGRIIRSAAAFQPTLKGIRVTASNETILAKQVIIAAGPWIVELLPRLKRHLTITRQAVGWFKPQASGVATFGEFPIFLIDSPQGLIYGFPDFEGRGVKAARHNHGPLADPDEWGPPPSDDELAAVKETLEIFVPGAAGPILERDICLYTNTRPADARIDMGEEFIIDRLPQDRRIIVASACSGHGAKFATAIGEILASLALDQHFEADAAFRLDRFSSFASA